MQTSKSRGKTTGNRLPAKGLKHLNIYRLRPYIFIDGKYSPFSTLAQPAISPAKTSGTAPAETSLRTTIPNGTATARERLADQSDRLKNPRVAPCTPAQSTLPMNHLTEPEPGVSVFPISPILPISATSPQSLSPHPIILIPPVRLYLEWIGNSRKLSAAVVLRRLPDIALVALDVVADRSSTRGFIDPMYSLLLKLFDSNFMPHALCLRDPQLIWLHVIADALIAASYFLIPIGLVRIIQKRKDQSVHWMFFLFAAFILSCGFTHVISIVTLWTPVYRFEGLLKAITALVSGATAFFLWQKMPYFTMLPTVEQWEQSNSALRAEVSAHKQALEKTALLAAIVTSSEDAIFSETIDGVITSWNTGAEKLFGYQSKEMIGGNVQRILPPDKLHEGTEISKRVREGVPLQNLETVRIRKNGSSVPIALTVSPIFDTDAKTIIGASKISRDISLRLQAQENFRRVFEAAPNAMVMIDESGRIVLINAETERLFGYDRAELLGQPVEILLPQRLRARHPGYRYDFFSSPEIVAPRAMGRGSELMGLRKDGSEFPVQVSLSPVRTESGQMAISAISDFTEVKRAEATIREFSALLERRVDERTAELEAARQQLSLSEARYRAYLEQAADAIFVHDHNGQLSEVNQQACTTLGYSRQELLRLNAFDIEAELPDLPLAQSLWSRIGPEYSPTIVGAHKRKDGSTFPTEARIGCFELTGQRQYLVNVRDISERKAAEAAAHADAERFRLIVESVNDYAIMMLDPKGIVVSWNIGAERLTGYQFSEIIGRDFACFYPPEDIQNNGLSLELDAALRTGRYAAEGERLRKDGSRFFADVVTVPVCDETGGLLGFAKIIHDVTARKVNERQMATRSAQLEAANKQLEVTAKRLEMAKDTIRAGIWSWDVRTNALDWDQRMYAIYGVPEKSPVNYGVWAAAVLPEDLPEVEAKLWGIVHAKSQGSGEFRIKTPDASVRFIQAGWATVLDDKGEVSQVIGINIDSTDRKFNEDLERQVNQRTAELAAANKDLEEFAYVASHDLKAPLRVIDNTSRWIEEDLAQHLSGDTRENMGLLRGRVKRMEKLLDDLLEYARIGRATDDRYSATMSGSQLIENIAALVCKPGFQLSVSPSVASIRVQQMPLQQILMNLIGNAIKHHHKTEGRVDISVSESPDFYTFSVRDDGPGIPPQFHEKIFKMFQTLRPRDQLEGSGMGLAMVRKNIEIFGGTIWLASKEGEGSTFEFTWPKQQRKKEAA